MAIPSQINAAFYSTLTADEKLEVVRAVFRQLTALEQVLERPLGLIDVVFNDIGDLEAFVTDPLVSSDITSAQLTSLINARARIRTLVASRINALAGITASSP